MNVSALAMDGTFCLPGLTPGVYTVQAMRDGTYFSAPRTVRVDASRQAPPLALDLPAPGKPLVREIGAKGALGQASLADTPSGPLASKYAPRLWAVDGKGRVRIEGLPFGKHRLRFPNGKIETVTIAPE